MLVAQPTSTMVQRTPLRLALWFGNDVWLRRATSSTSTYTEVHVAAMHLLRFVDLRLPLTDLQWEDSPAVRNCRRIRDAKPASLNRSHLCMRYKHQDWSIVQISNTLDHWS
jgi:hypothetical protein